MIRQNDFANIHTILTPVQKPIYNLRVTPKFIFTKSNLTKIHELLSVQTLNTQHRQSEIRFTKIIITQYIPVS